MKVIDLSHRTIFVNDIVSIYNEYKCGEFVNHTNYYIETKHGRISVEEHDYKKVKEYLLSLNEEKEDKKIEKIKDYIIFKTMGLDCKYNERKEPKNYSLEEKEIVDKINEIIDKINKDTN